MNKKKPNESPATLYRKIIFFISFLCGTLLPHDKKRRSHWAWITDQIMLGALPIKTKFLKHGAHQLKIIEQAKQKKHPLGLIVSIVTPFELKGEGILLTPVSPEDWHHLGVETIQLSIPDFSAEVSVDAMKPVMEKIKQTIEKGRSVYIHCKAGRARSWMTLMCYLVAEKGMDFEAAKNLIKSKRTHVCPTKDQMEFVRVYTHSTSKGEVEEFDLRVFRN